MTKLKLLLLVLFIATTVNAQISEASKSEAITVGRAMRHPGSPSLQYWEQGNDRYYSIIYQNTKYSITDIKSIGFYASEEELEQLYNWFKAGFEAKEIESLNVGKGQLSRGKVGSMIMVFVREEGKTDGEFYLSKKGLDKMFGKKK